MRQLTKQRCRDATSSLVLTFQPNHLYIYGRKRQINYKFIPTSLFRGRPLIRGFSSPDEWATTKQACRDELVVYLSFSSIYTTLYFYVLSTVLPKSSFTLDQHCTDEAQKAETVLSAVRYSSLALQSFCFHVQIEHSTRMSHCR